MHNNTASLTHIFNYIYFAVILLWAALQVWVNFDGAGRIPATLTYLAFFVNFSQIRTFFSRPARYWFLWIAYVIICFLVFKSNIRWPFLFFSNLISCPLIMTLIAIEYRHDAKFLLKCLSWCMIFFAFTGITHFSIQFDDGRLKSELGNDLPNFMITMLFIVILRLKRKEIRPIWAILIFILAFYAIIISATRKAFIGASVIIFFSLLPYFNFKRIRSILAFILLGVLLASAIFLLDNSRLGNRFEETQDNEIGKSLVNNDNLFFDLVGDRSDQYIIGWKLFKAHPICGVGLRNFQAHTGYAYPLHTEYMVQLAECGLIGFFLFICFWWGIIRRNGHYFSKKDHDIGTLNFGFIFSLLLISFTGWTYLFPTYFAGIGIILGASQEESSTKPSPLRKLLRFSHRTYIHKDVNRN